MITTFKLINEFKHWQPCVMALDVKTTAFTQSGKDGNNEKKDWTKKPPVTAVGFWATFGHNAPN